MDDNKFYRDNGQTPPERISHNVTPDNIVEKLTPLNPTNWRLEGNQLIADTSMGRLVNYIDPSYIMTGVDENNRPQLTKIQT